MRPGEWFLAVVLFSWWLLSLSFQLSPAARARLPTLFDLGLLSGYRFFAPTPRAADLHFEVRTRNESGQDGCWQRLGLPASSVWHTVFWNPHARAENARIALLGRLISKSKLQSRTALRSSAVYLQLLHSASARCSHPATLQFRILSGKDFDTARPTQLAFLSDWHTES